MWHLPLWPFKQISNWLRRHYEKQQLKEQIGLQQKQHLLEITPDLDVDVCLIIDPDPPRRHDIPLLQVVVMNYGGKTNILQASFRVSLPEYPTGDQKKYLTGVNMPRGKKQELSFDLKRTIIMDVMIRHATLKFDYELKFAGLNDKIEERKQSYTYNPETKNFVRD